MRKGLMLVVIIVLGLLNLTVSPSSTQQTEDRKIEQALNEARQVSTDLAEKVRGLLLEEIKKGGFGNAVRVCSVVAQEITSSFNQQKGHHLRRVSLRHRNPRNVPDPFEQEKLKAFDRLNREKKLADEYFEVVKEEGQENLRYLKPLIVQPVCLSCHGPKENLSAEVKAILKEKYPRDRATGFLVGDVRGAISVKIYLPKSF